MVGNLSQVATDLASLIGINHRRITSTIDNLQVVAADIQNNQQDLATSLSTLGAGLAPYIQISQWGQWFAVETIYTCLANQTVCPYYQPGNPPAGLGAVGRPAAAGAAVGASRRRACRQPRLQSPKQRSSALVGCPPRIEPRQMPEGRQRARTASVEVKAVTERNPKVVGIVAVIIMSSASWPSSSSTAACSPRATRSTARFPNAAGITKGTDGHGGRRQGRLGHLGRRCTATPSTPSSRSATRCVLPHETTAAVQVETLLGVVDVTLQPVSGWDDPLTVGRAHHRHLGADRVLPTAEHGAQRCCRRPTPRR